MRFRFKTKQLQLLYTTEKGARRYPRQVVDAFFDVMSIIRAAKDERDFYALKSLHWERLSGNRRGQHSMRLNQQWRLVCEIDEAEKEHCLVIVNIEDYHS